MNTSAGGVETEYIQCCIFSLAWKGFVCIINYRSFFHPSPSPLDGDPKRRPRSTRTRTAAPSCSEENSWTESSRPPWRLHHHHQATSHVTTSSRKGRETKERNSRRLLRLWCCFSSRCSSHCLTSSMQSSYMYMIMRHRSCSTSTALDVTRSSSTRSRILA